MKKKFFKKKINLDFGNLKKDFNKEIIKHKYSLWFFFGITFLAIVIAGFLGYKIYFASWQLNRNVNQLDNLSNYKLPVSLFKLPEIKSFSTIKELQQYNNNLLSQQKYFMDYFASLQAPYEYFLKFIYLPRLNIWKDNYFGTWDLDLIGEKFLDENPFEKINLINYWSDFFRKVGIDSYNQVGNIKFGEKSFTKKLFYIPFEVNFLSPGKRTFLFLIDKLAIVSSAKNIQLIDEFFWNLWEVIKENKSDEIKKIAANLAFTGKNYQDKTIGYDLFVWKNGGESKLLDENILKLSAMRSVDCKLKFDECLTVFRQKFISVPSLAYMFDLGGNVIDNFKNFVLQLSPVLIVDGFNFDNVNSKNFIGQSYEGYLSLKFYGWNVSDKEVLELEKKLGNKCFSNSGLVLNPDYALNLVEKFTLENAENLLDSNLKDKYLHLQSILQSYKKTFSQKNNYQKLISLFEIYRMLFDFGFCK